MALPDGKNVMTLLSLAGGAPKDLGNVCIGDDDFGNEIIALAQTCAASVSVTLNAQCLQALGDLARRKWEVLHSFYAAYTQAITAERQMRPNAATTLYGPDADCGAVYACDTVIP